MESMNRNHTRKFISSFFSIEETGNEWVRPYHWQKQQQQQCLFIWFFFYFRIVSEPFSWWIEAAAKYSLNRAGAEKNHSQSHQVIQFEEQKIIRYRTRCVELLFFFIYLLSPNNSILVGHTRNMIMLTTTFDTQNSALVSPLPMQLWTFVPNRFRSETMRKTTYSDRRQNWHWHFVRMKLVSLGSDAFVLTKRDVADDICCQSLNGQSLEFLYCFSSKLLSLSEVSLQRFRAPNTMTMWMSFTLPNECPNPASSSSFVTQINLHFSFGLARATFNDWLHLTFYRRSMRTVLII